MQYTRLDIDNRRAVLEAHLLAAETDHYNSVVNAMKFQAAAADECVSEDDRTALAVQADGYERSVGQCEISVRVLTKLLEELEQELGDG